MAAIKAKLQTPGLGSFICSVQVTDKGLQVKRGASEVLMDLPASRLTGLQWAAAAGQLDIQVEVEQGVLATVSFQAMSAAGQAPFVCLANNLYQVHRSSERPAPADEVVHLSPALAKQAAILGGSASAMAFLTSNKSALGFADFEGSKHTDIEGEALPETSASHDTTAAPVSANTKRTAGIDAPAAAVADAQGMAALQKAVTLLQQKLNAAMSQLELEQQGREEAEQACSMAVKGLRQAQMDLAQARRPESPRRTTSLRTREELQTLQQQLKDLQGLHAQLQQEHQAAIHGLEEAMLVLTGQSEQLALDEQDQAVLQEHVAAAEQALSESRAALAKAEDVNAGLQAQLQELKSEEAANCSQEADPEHNVAIEFDEPQIPQLENAATEALAAPDTQMAASEREQGLQATICELRAQLVAAEGNSKPAADGRTADLQRKVTELGQALQHANTQQGELVSSLTESLAVANDLEDQLAEGNKRAQQASSALDEATALLNESAVQLQHSRSELEAARAEAKSLQGRAEEAERKWAAQDGKISALLGAKDRAGSRAAALSAASAALAQAKGALLAQEKLQRDAQNTQPA